MPYVKEPKTWNGFRRAIFNALKKAKAPKRLIEVVGNFDIEGGAVFQALWNTWEKLEWYVEENKQLLKKHEGIDEEEVWEDFVDQDIYEMVLDMVGGHTSRWEHGPGDAPAKFDPKPLAHAVVKALGGQVPKHVAAARHAMARKLLIAAEILANSHLLEQLHDSLQPCYAKLRSTYPDAQLTIDPAEDQITITWASPGPDSKTFATATIAPTRNGNKVRIIGESELFGELNKLSAQPRDLVYHIDSWLERG